MRCLIGFCKSGSCCLLLFLKIFPFPSHCKLKNVFQFTVSSNTKIQIRSQSPQRIQQLVQWQVPLALFNLILNRIQQMSHLFYLIVAFPCNKIVYAHHKIKAWANHIACLLYRLDFWLSGSMLRSTAYLPSARTGFHYASFKALLSLASQRFLEQQSLDILGSWDYLRDKSQLAAVFNAHSSTGVLITQVTWY